jgi:GT2 family glycosyltransferase
MSSSVIVCTRNRKADILNFIASLYKQTLLPQQFVIVDSSDTRLGDDKEFADIFYAKRDRITLDYVHCEPGLTRQRNIGIKKVTEDIVYFFDDDIVLDEDYLQKISDTFAQNPAFYGGMGAVKGVPPKMAWKTRIKWLVKRFFLLQHDYGNGKFLPSGFAAHPYGTTEFKKVEVLGGCCFCFRREVFAKHLFDESLFGYSYMEDSDFCRRVSYEYTLFYNPQAQLEHRHSPVARGRITDVSKMLMKNHRYFFKKNFYPRNRFLIVAHLWSLIGLFVFALLFEKKEVLVGYLKAIDIIGNKDL